MSQGVTLVRASAQAGWGSLERFFCPRALFSNQFTTSKTFTTSICDQLSADPGRAAPAARALDPSRGGPCSAGGPPTEGKGEGGKRKKREGRKKRKKKRKEEGPAGLFPVFVWSSAVVLFVGPTLGAPPLHLQTRGVVISFSKRSSKNYGPEGHHPQTPRHQLHHHPGPR